MWGTIFLFDFRLNGFDILPDFIGYILIVLGLSEVIDLHRYFNTARILAAVLIIPSFFSVYQAPGGGQVFVSSSGANNPLNPFIIGTGILSAIIYLIFAYHLYIGLREKALEINQHELAERAKLVFTLIVIINVSLFLAFLIPFLVIPLFILSIVILVLEIRTLSQASELFDNLQTF